MSGSHKQKEIIEIFYNKDGLEIRPEDSEYERFLNGSEDYFGSYFVDEDGSIIREDNPQRAKRQKEKDTIRKEQAVKEESERKVLKIVISIIAIIAAIFIIYIISQKTAEDINKPYIEINSNISSEYCPNKNNNCSTVDASKISIEVSVSINSRYTSKYAAPRISNLTSDKRYLCQEVKANKYICEVELVEGRNNLEVSSTVTPKDSNLSWDHSEKLTVYYSPGTSATLRTGKVIL